MLAAERNAEHVEGYRYERRRPEESVLYRVVMGALHSLLDGSASAVTCT